MATRIYLPNTGTTDINPTLGTYTETTGATRIKAVTSRISSAMTSKTQAHTATAANSTFLSRQYVIGPLAGQTYAASTVKGTIRVLESAANDNLDAMRLAVRVVASDATTFRSPDIFAQANSTVAEFNTSLRAKRLATGGATSQVVITEGDYLVIEIATTNTAIGTSLSDSISYGDDSATDLGDNETDTAANNPFIELAGNIKFLQKGFGQAQADIKATSRGYGQAQATIAIISHTEYFAEADETNVLNPTITVSNVSWSQNNLIAVIVHGKDNAATTGTVAATGLTFGSSVTSVRQGANLYAILWATIAGSSGSSDIAVTITANVHDGDIQVTVLVIKSLHSIVIPSIDATAVNNGLSVTPSVDLVNTTGKRIYYFFDHRTQTFTVDASDNLIAIRQNDQSPNATSGNRVSTSSYFEDVSTAATFNGSGTIGSTDWTALSFSVKEIVLNSAQAQADIKAVGYGSGQAQAAIKGNAFAQANADIKATLRGCAQVNASIATGNHNLIDTATRTVSNGWGTPDSGPDWITTYTTTVANFSTDGSVGKWTPTGLDNDSIAISQIDIGNADIAFDFKLASLPAGGTDLIRAFVRGPINSATDSYGYAVDLFIWDSPAGKTDVNFIGIANGSGFNTASTSNYITLLANTIYHVRYQIINPSVNNNYVIFRFKVWQTVEPEWTSVTNSAQGDDPKLKGNGGFRLSLLSREANTFTFDNWNIQVGILAGWGQAKADIKQTYFGLGQAQTDIKASGFGLGQSNADIKAIGYGLGQSQADIKTTYFGLGQSQADIKAVGYGLAQSQADIKAVSFGLGQANADILAIGYGLGQSQADIKATNNGFGQTQSDIKVTSFAFAQAQAFLVRNAFGQAQGFISKSKGLGQAAGLINGAFSSPLTDSFDRIVVDSLGTSDNGDVYVLVTGAPANADVDGSKATLVTSNTLHQVWDLQQTLINVRGIEVSAIIAIDKFPTSITAILQLGAGVQSVLSDFTASSLVGIKITTNTNGTVTFSTNVYGQGNGTTVSYTLGDLYNIKVHLIPASGTQPLVSRRKVWKVGDIEPGWSETNSNDLPSGGHVRISAQIDADANGPFTWTIDNFHIEEAWLTQYGQAKAAIKATGQGFGQSQADIKATNNAFGQANADILVTNQTYGQAQADILVAGYGSGNTQADIKATGQSYGQANADIVTTYQAYAQAQADILVTTYGFGQSNADIKTTEFSFGQTQADIKQTSQSYAQSQADIKTTSYGLGQANSDIKATGFGSGQTQASISGQAQGYGQAQAKIAVSANYGFGQTQGDILVTSNSFAQAQASIQITNTVFGQAQSDIKTKNQVWAQSQAQIKMVIRRYGQAQADILTTNRGFGQANSDIKKTTSSSANAQSDIKVIVTNIGQTQASMLVFSRVYANTQASVLVSQYRLGQAQASILRTVNAWAQTQAQISKLQGAGQAQAYIFIKHHLKKVRVSDHLPIMVTASDRASTVGLQDRQLGAKGSDRNTLDAEISDRNSISVKSSDVQF